MGRKSTQSLTTPKKSGYYVYLGPTINGMIQNAMIIQGTREDAEKKIANVIAKYPRAKTLLIPDETIAQDREDVNKPGTRLYTEYRRLVRELKK